MEPYFLRVVFRPVAIAYLLTLACRRSARAVPRHRGTRHLHIVVVLVEVVWCATGQGLDKARIRDKGAGRDKKNR